MDYLLGMTQEVTTIHFEKDNLGVTGAMNWFLDRTKKDKYIAKVDNDTIVPEGWLTKMQTALQESKLDGIQAQHHFLIRRFNTWEDLIAGTEKIETTVGNIFKFAHIGGSGIVLRRNAVIAHMPEEKLLFGWGVYQQKYPLSVGFFDGVFIELLDRSDYNITAPTADIDYLAATGRKIEVNL